MNVVLFFSDFLDRDFLDIIHIKPNEEENGEKEFVEYGIDENGIINQGQGETNRVEGLCLGESLVLSANGKELLEVTDNTHVSGGVGVIAGNQLSGIGLEILFDNFVIVEP